MTIEEKRKWYRETFRVHAADETILNTYENYFHGIDLPKQVGGNHYIMPIEPIDYIVKNGLGYREGNVVKYVSRHQKKNGAEDIKKAIHYLEMILEDYEKESK